MARGDITVRNELRPCLVDGKPCLFHKWVTEFMPRAHYIMDGDDESEELEWIMCETTMALVEHEDGTVSTESVQLVRFLDTNAHMGDM